MCILFADVQVLSIHSTTRVETPMCRLFADVQGISIHSTTRVETGGNIRRKEGPGNFNPLHHEGGDWESNTFPALRQDFNPLHHEGGDILRYHPLLGAMISIHSTTRVETAGPDSGRKTSGISIHSTTRVETQYHCTSFFRFAISIHSTTRVETVWIVYPITASEDFNPLHHEGGDTTGFNVPMGGGKFQSTPPRGWRPSDMFETVGIDKDFNPLHHEGGDFIRYQDGFKFWISIHSTTRVETCKVLAGDMGGGISIHSTTRVETYAYHHAVYYLTFQSTPPRGWRRFQMYYFPSLEAFQSTPPRGWRRKDFMVFWITDDFNPLHHEGGDANAFCFGVKLIISIHSTTRVETFYASKGWMVGKFQSTPPRGWRRLRFRNQRSNLVFQSTPPRGWRHFFICFYICDTQFQSTPPRGWRQQYYTITTTILQHISTNKSYPTPSNHGQPSLYTRKSVLIVQIFRCESPRKSMFASGSHQNTLYRFTARGQVRISAVLPH